MRFNVAKVTPNIPPENTYKDLGNEPLKYHIDTNDSLNQYDPQTIQK